MDNRSLNLVLYMEYQVYMSPKSLDEKKVTRTREGEGQSTFDTTHSIDMIFRAYNKLHLFFQLNKTAWVSI